MQKTTISTPPKTKPINYFKYEMKETNQLLKDLISCNISDTHSRSRQNKQQNQYDKMFREDISHKKIQNNTPQEPRKKNSYKKLYDSQNHTKQVEKVQVKYENQYQNNQKVNLKNFIIESPMDPKRKKPDNFIEHLILQKFYVDGSQNQEAEDKSKPFVQKYRGRELDFSSHQKLQQTKQAKKQKKGLANISLRVKNIVSQHKKLTYKQVSDLVLEYSKDEIQQLEQSLKIKEIKNIKRRVYDALNVLVAVGILGKHQRCVTMTEWTSIPGKKHSNQWQKINSKVEQISKLKKICSDKSQALKLLMQKYNAVTALRNKHQAQADGNENIVKDIQIARQDSHVNQNQNVSEDKILIFPIIMFCPAFEQEDNDKLTVQFEQSEDQKQSTQKMKITGKNITILGDFDCALQLDLNRYRDSEKQKRLLQQINQYASDCIKKKVSSYKFETDDYCQANIEEYFNENVFESK